MLKIFTEPKQWNWEAKERERWNANWAQVGKLIPPLIIIICLTCTHIHGELSQYINFRHLKGDDINSLNYKELISLEDALENGLLTIRDKHVANSST